jgi:pyrroline-5-carboxylate reductase
LLKTLSTVKITWVGAGSMAEAMIRGLVDGRKAPGENLSAINRSNAEQLAEFRDRYGIFTANDPEASDRYIREADILVLAMKPKDAAVALRRLRYQVDGRQQIVSVIAGLSIATIQSLLGRPLAIARTMPNTSSTIGLGATGISFSREMDEPSRDLILQMFKSFGEVAQVDEEQLDIVTGVSGSGPAYVYYLMEAMIEGGIRGGLTAEAARRLTVQTVLGAAQMVIATEENPGELRRKVTSPGGTTQAAIETLDSCHFAEGVTSAVLRAAERAREMGAELARSAQES